MSHKQEKLYRMDKVDRVASYIFTVFTWVAIVAAVYLALITVINVIMRFIFSKNILFGIETSQIALAVVALGSLPVVTLYNGHIKVDLVVGNFKQKGQDLMTVINLLLCGGMCGILSYGTFLKAQKIMAQGSHTTVLRFPIWTVYALIAVMMGFTALCCLFNIIHLLVTGKTVEAMTFQEVRDRLRAHKHPNGAQSNGAEEGKN